MSLPPTTTSRSANVLSVARYRPAVAVAEAEAEEHLTRGRVECGEHMPHPACAVIGGALAGPGGQLGNQPRPSLYNVAVLPP